LTKVGTVESVWRYPVKSMAGERLDEIFVGYAGVFGDRFCAIHNAAGPEAFPYLTGRNNPSVLRYRPRFRDASLAARPLNQAAAEGAAIGLTPLYPSRSSASPSRCRRRKAIRWRSMIRNC
jgi:uncharacterized protein